MPAPTLQELGIDRLSVEDRIALAEAIWDSIPFVAEPPIPLSDAQRQVLRQRLAEARAEPENFIPWDQVQANLKARLQG